MTFDLESISKSKRAFRRRLAQMPIVEKLRMLDALRERMLTLRSAHSSPLIREESTRYRTKRK
jgi:hypothetical protein